MVTRISINGTVDLVTYGGVNKLVNTKEWVATFRAYLIQVCEVDTHPSFPIYLLNHHIVGESVWVVHFSYEPSFQELVNFI